MRFLPGVPLLTAVYACAMGSAAAGDLLLGALLAVLLLLALAPHRTQGPAAAPPLWRRALAAVPFAAAVAADATTGALNVAATVVGLRPLRRPGIVRVPIGERSDRGVVVSALVLTLSPGSLLLDIDWQRREMLFHVMDAGDPDRLRARIDRFYRRWQKAVFP